MRIENDQFEPSKYFLRKISQRLGYDFEAYYFQLMTNGEDSAFFEQRKELKQLSVAKDFPMLHKKVQEYSSLPMYQIFENQKMLMHYDSIYYASYEKDYEKSNKLCLEIIQDDDPNATMEDFTSRVFSKYAIYSAHIIALNYAAQGNQEQMIQIYNELINRIAELDRDEISHYQSNEYRRNLHQTLLFNLSVTYLVVDDFDNAESCIDTAIKYASDYSTLFLFAEISSQKAKILCEKKDYPEAKRYLNLSSLLYQIRGKQAKSQDILKEFWEAYPETK